MLVNRHGNVRIMKKHGCVNHNRIYEQHFIQLQKLHGMFSPQLVSICSWQRERVRNIAKVKHQLLSCPGQEAGRKRANPQCKGDARRQKERRVSTWCAALTVPWILRVQRRINLLWCERWTPLILAIRRQRGYGTCTNHDEKKNNNNEQKKKKIYIIIV